MAAITLSVSGKRLVLATIRRADVHGVAPRWRLETGTPSCLDYRLSQPCLAMSSGGVFGLNLISLAPPPPPYSCGICPL
jgi:hypothetical protein